ncbi:hypothetical protein XENORESO_013417 [Xenotaenia resolanae]|uniref:Condensin-2 complex subunit H2 n=1 Tax=Xenotaenia resolanae TaxID=208358 RepID=A0ABV0W8H2_9TELE
MWRSSSQVFPLLLLNHPEVLLSAPGLLQARLWISHGSWQWCQDEVRIEGDVCFVQLPGLGPYENPFPESSHIMESTESRYAHLLQPIRELTKNWEIDVASELNDYLEEVNFSHVRTISSSFTQSSICLQLDEMCITLDGGKTRLNFAEAALLIQGSTCIYSKKVELLHSLVYQTLQYINNKSKKRSKEAAEALHGAAGATQMSHDAEDVDEFTPLETEVFETFQKSDLDTIVNVVPLPPESLIPPETHEKNKLPLISVKGEVVCSQKDFRINLFIPGQEDLILLMSKSAAASRFLLDQNLEPIEMEHPGLCVLLYLIGNFASCHIKILRANRDRLPIPNWELKALNVDLLVEGSGISWSRRFSIVYWEYPGLLGFQQDLQHANMTLVLCDERVIGPGDVWRSEDNQNLQKGTQAELWKQSHWLRDIMRSEAASTIPPDDAAENFLPFNEDMDLDQDPEEHIERQQVSSQAQSEGRMIRERRDLEVEKQEEMIPAAVETWTLHDPYSVNGEDKPFKAGKCYKVPNGLDDGGKRKRRRPALLQDFRTWFSGTFDPPEPKLKVGPTFPDLNYIYLSFIKDKVKKQKRICRRVGVVMSEEELRRTFLQPEEVEPVDEFRHAELPGQFIFCQSFLNAPTHQTPFCTFIPPRTDASLIQSISSGFSSCLELRTLTQ